MTAFGYCRELMFVMMFVFILVCTAVFWLMMNELLFTFRLGMYCGLAGRHARGYCDIEAVWLMYIAEP